MRTINNTKIVAIGGGEIGRPGFPVETTSIDREILSLTGKKHPKVLFIPTASNDSLLYYKTVQQHFGKRLDCIVDALFLVDRKHNQHIIRKKVFASDIIYVGGGNTEKMMKVWRKSGVDKILKQACAKGIVLSGLSAGSICWFTWGISDSRKMIHPAAPLITVSGLGLIKALHCPHYNVEKDRKPELKKMMKRTPGVAIAIDNCCAIEVINDTYRIINSKSSANAYKVYWKSKVFHEVVIRKEKTFRPLNGLLTKD